MKKTLLIFTWLLLTILNAVAAENPRFFITTSSNSKDGEVYFGYFITIVSNFLQKDFPCVEINDQKSVAEMLEQERQKQLVGKGSDEQLQNIGKSLSNDYLISLDVQIRGNTTMLSALCMNTRKVETLARAMITFPNSEAGTAPVEKISRELIDGLHEYEICPFTGPVNLVISSSRDTTETEEYPVYCNGTDSNYKKVTSVNNSTESTWNLQRKDIPRTEGTMNFSTYESLIIEEMNGCYKCASGREGGRTYHQKNTFRVEGNGISHQSIYDGKPQQDTRIELEFRDDGTYLIKPKGTSLPATGEEKVEISAEGTCDNITRETKTNPKEVTIPLNVVFGPYPGKSSDKILKQSDEMSSIDPISGEQKTVTIDFELKHD